MLYKVVKEEGVTVDGLDFAKDEVFDLESDAFNVPELLAEGAIEETSPEADNDLPPEPMDVEIPEEKDEEEEVA